MGGPLTNEVLTEYFNLSRGSRDEKLAFLNQVSGYMNYISMYHELPVPR
jgi:hypothetical protein